MNRRDFLTRLALTGIVPYVGTGGLLQSRSPGTKVQKKSVIVVFLRGGIDGLSAVIPFGDSNFSKDKRPNIFIPKENAHRIDDFFSFHPQMSSMKELWERGILTVIHQTGEPSSETRSHFFSQDLIESGSSIDKSKFSGFLARASAQLPDQQIKLKSYAAQTMLPKSLYGASDTLSINCLDKFAISDLKKSSPKTRKLRSYTESVLDDYLQNYSGKATDFLDYFDKAVETKISADFPPGDFSLHLQDMARIINAGIHVPFMVTECEGWDTHVGQGGEDGNLSGLFKNFSDSLSTFVKEIGEKIDDVTVVTITEFGRRVAENGNFGTDHGRGSCMFVINGNVKSKNIVADWKDLKQENLVNGRDVPITTDYRAVLTEIMATQLKILDTQDIFPMYSGGKSLGIFRG